MGVRERKGERLCVYVSARERDERREKEREDPI